MDGVHLRPRHNVLIKELFVALETSYFFLRNDDSNVLEILFEYSQEF